MSDCLSNIELLTLLDRLDEVAADDLESEELDFKPWTNPKDDLKVAVEDAVCFANAGGGVVLFGVDDKQFGRSKATGRAGVIFLVVKLNNCLLAIR